MRTPIGCFDFTQSHAIFITHWFYEMKRSVYKRDCFAQSSVQFNNQCVINHIISTQITAYFSVDAFFPFRVSSFRTVNVCRPELAMWCNKFACVIQESLLFFVVFVVFALRCWAGVLAVRFLSLELQHSLISLNFFGYVSIFRHIFRCCNGLCAIADRCHWNVHATLSTTYVNERNLITFVDFDETYHIAQIFLHIECVCAIVVAWPGQDVSIRRLSYVVSIVRKPSRPKDFE